mmetsp:Transcript_88858/g.176707  ORF Transcript_88858/g.176707 Transcript_88858/m.176707 type:complete len:225 (+) Transcript_88858:688-1362(+)
MPQCQKPKRRNPKSIRMKLNMMKRLPRAKRKRKRRKMRLTGRIGEAVIDEVVVNGVLKKNLTADAKRKKTESGVTRKLLQWKRRVERASGEQRTPRVRKSGTLASIVNPRAMTGGALVMGEVVTVMAGGRRTGHRGEKRTSQIREATADPNGKPNHLERAQLPTRALEVKRKVGDLEKKKRQILGGQRHETAMAVVQPAQRAFRRKGQNRCPSAGLIWPAGHHA